MPVMRRRMYSTPPSICAGLPGVKPETADAVDQLLEDAAAATLEAEELGRRGVWVTTIVDEDYPPTLIGRLADHAPPVIFGVGNRSLLNEPGVGVVGSREVGDAGAEVAKSLAVEASVPGASGGVGRGARHRPIGDEQRLC